MKRQTKSQPNGHGTTAYARGKKRVVTPTPEHELGKRSLRGPWRHIVFVHVADTASGRQGVGHVEYVGKAAGWRAVLWSGPDGKMITIAAPGKSPEWGHHPTKEEAAGAVARAWTFDAQAWEVYAFNLARVREAERYTGHLEVFERQLATMATLREGLETHELYKAAGEAYAHMARAAVALRGALPVATSRLAR